MRKLVLVKLEVQVMSWVLPNAQDSPPLGEVTAIAPASTPKAPLSALTAGLAALEMRS